jgi:hypothetical protein
MKTFGLLILILAFTFTVSAQSEEDRNGVKQAALDYVESVYEVNPSKAERSVHPELVKRGFFIKKGGLIRRTQ